MGQVPVRFGAAVRQYGVGEVIVLIDQHIEADAALPNALEQLVKLGVNRRCRQDALAVFIRKKVRIALQCPSQLHVAVVLELLLQGFRRIIDRGEVKAQHHIAVALFGGLAANVGAAEDLLKFVSPIAVVIVLQHGHPARLAKASGAD